MVVFCAWLVQKDRVFTSLLCFVRCMQPVISHTTCTCDTADTKGTLPWLWGRVQLLWKEQLSMSITHWGESLRSVKAPKKLAEMPSGPDPIPWGLGVNSVEKVSPEKRTEKEDHL